MSSWKKPGGRIASFGGNPALREGGGTLCNDPMKSRHLLLLALIASLGGTACLRAAEDPFAWPPITAQQKPWAFNWWMGSAVDKTNLTHELERYAAAGLGGIHIIPIYGARGFDDKYIDYLSPQWMEMMGWAVTEAHRLGMGVDMTTGTGWCFGGPQVTDQDANASVVVKTYAVKAGEKLKPKFDRESTQALVAYSPDGTSVELTDKLSADGDVDFSPTNGTWTIYAISQKPSGQKVKRAAPGGEGWMLNLIYPPAMDDFLKPYTAAFAAYTGPKPRAQYHDSYEYRSDWSPNFFAEFEKRRGYKLQTELPALFPESRSTNPASRFADPEHNARVLCDYRQTVSEIMAEESMPAWTQWAHSEGFITRYQAHGSPANWLDLYATADIPETEMFHSDRSKLISKFASSAAHVTGKNLVSAETGTWLEEHFTEKLSDVKYLMDDMFLSGINHLFYHGCCYSPDEAGWPGWHFYAATEMNPRNSIWRDALAVNTYAARVQSVLQSGQPDNDILLYWNISDFWMQPGDKLLPQLTVHARDWFEGQPIGEAAKKLGQTFDYVSDAQLKKATVVDGLVQMPGGKYQIIIVPKCKYIPLETFKNLIALAQNGATVFFENEMPKDVSGVNDLQKQQKQFATLKSEIMANQDRQNHSSSLSVDCPMGLGHIKIGKFSPSMTHERGIIGSGLSFVRRSFEDGWYYFIVNQSGRDYDGSFSLDRTARAVVVLDPMTGAAGLAKTYLQGTPQDPNSPLVDLQLARGESVILRALKQSPASEKELTSKIYWSDWDQPNAEIRSDWKIKFIKGGPVLPADYQTNKLASWTTFPDTNCQAFGGTAKYETMFDAPIPHSALRTPQFLDLGDVRQSARVRVNGRDYGTLITPPFRVVVDNLKPTGNTLEVEVTSVDANHIRDLDRRGVKWKTFRDINIVDINYKPFDASNWALTDCGLLGPVTLTPVTAK